MFKTMLVSFFFLLAVSPIFAINEIRDTAQLPDCDTIIDKNGAATYVKISSVSRSLITYKPCSNETTKAFTIEISKVADIKSKTFSLAKPSPIFISARRLFRIALISVLTFWASFSYFIKYFVNI